MENDIDSYLEALKRDECYRVVRVLKEAPHETTELVCFAGANEAELGPFVRKRIKREACMGAAYGALLEAQRAGARFLHLPRIEDCYERDDELVVIMEFVRGETLHEAVYRRDPSLDLAREVFPQLCDAVTELHEGFAPPLIHRDLKPGNVILAAESLTLIDFGIARTYREGAEGDTANFGTRAYAPPEQFGYGQTDVRSDVYALGMLLYYLLTEEVPSPRLAGGAFALPAVPTPLRAVLSCATAFDPAARYQSARDLRAAFEAACAELDAEGPRARSGFAGRLGAGALAPVVANASAGEGLPAALGEAGAPGSAPPAPAGAPGSAPLPAWMSFARRVLGVVRNGAAGLVAALFVLVGILMQVAPAPDNSAVLYPPALRWMGVVGIELIVAPFPYLLMDRQGISRRLGYPLPRVGSASVALVGTGFALFAVMMALNGDFAA